MITHALTIGGLGFIGANLVDRLLAAGVQTTVVTPSLLTTEMSARVSTVVVVLS